MLMESLRQIGRVQKIDSMILELKRRFAAVDPGRAAMSAFEAAKAAADAAEARLKSVRSEIEDLELQSKSIDQKIEKEQARLYSGGIYNAKDADAIDREVKNLRERKSKIEDRLIELYDEIEPATQAYEKASSQLKEEEKKLHEVQKHYAEIEAEFKAKLSALAALRQRETPKCDDSLLKKYDEVRKRRGGIGLAEVVDGVCGACKTAVPKKQLGDLKEGTTLQTCENCLRYLYLPQDQ